MKKIKAMADCRGIKISDLGSITCAPSVKNRTIKGVWLKTSYEIRVIGDFGGGASVFMFINVLRKNILLAKIGNHKMSDILLKEIAKSAIEQISERLDVDYIKELLL